MDPIIVCFNSNALAIAIMFAAFLVGIYVILSSRRRKGDSPDHICLEGLPAELVERELDVILSPECTDRPQVPEDPSSTNAFAQEARELGVPYDQFRTAVRVLISRGGREIASAWGVRSLIVALSNATGELAQVLRDNAVTLDHVRDGSATIFQVAAALDPARPQEERANLSWLANHIDDDGAIHAATLLANPLAVMGEQAYVQELLDRNGRIYEITLAGGETKICPGAYFEVTEGNLTVFDVDGAILLYSTSGQWSLIRRRNPKNRKVGR